MKIIFLDIDGVLNTHKYTVLTKDHEEHTYKFLERDKVRLLKKIVDTTNARLVLSSTWRRSFNQNLEPSNYLSFSLVDAFNNEGLKLYSKTEDFNDDRYLEISSWLDVHPETGEFTILDDHDYGWKDLRHFWVKTSFYVGLTESIAYNIINLLK